MKFPYQFAGGPRSWKSGPPMQSRAADTVSLGSLETPTLALPAPGAPEPINNAYAMGEYDGQYVAVGDDQGQYVAVGDDCGCGCKGAGTCGKGLGATDAGSVVLRVGSAAAAYYAYKHAKKSKGTMKYVLYAIAAAAGYEAVLGK